MLCWINCETNSSSLLHLHKQKKCEYCITFLCIFWKSFSKGVLKIRHSKYEFRKAWKIFSWILSGRSKVASFRANHFSLVRKMWSLEQSENYINVRRFLIWSINKAGQFRHPQEFLRKNLAEPFAPGRICRMQQFSKWSGHESRQIIHFYEVLIE